MNNKGSTGWIVGVVIASFICLIMLIMFIAVISDVGGSNEPSMSVDEMGAHCYRASELFRAGIYYTDKALTTDPQNTSYDEWKSYVDKAEEYWDALESELDLIEGYADTDGFQDAFEDTEIKASGFEKLGNIIVPTAYAYDSADIINTYD